MGTLLIGLEMVLKEKKLYVLYDGLERNKVIYVS